MSWILEDLDPWMIPVSPFDGESFGHYLPRFRAANDLRPQHLSKLLGVSSPVIDYWETPSRRRRPSPSQMKDLADLLQLSVDELSSMFIPNTESVCLQTRVCPACYREGAYHRVQWQYESVDVCKSHMASLIAACPDCNIDFQTPRFWQRGPCHICGDAGLYRSL